MKVISKPDYTAWTHKFTCTTCKSELQADYTDLKYRVEKKFYSSHDGDGPGSISSVDYFYLVYPVCSEETGVIPNAHGVNMSYLLQEKIKKDYHESIKNSRHK